MVNLASGATWLGNMLQITAGVLLIFVIVVSIHELGHFLVARWCGVKVKTFSIGFGKELFAFVDRHGTRWRVALLPLGGYVNFMDDENAASVPSKDKLEQMSSQERAGSFQDKPLWQRASVVAAGPIANFLLAIMVYALSFSLIGSFDVAPVVEEVAVNSAAERAGIKPGDIIKQIDGRQIKGFSEVQRAIGMNPGRELPIVVERDGRAISLLVTPDRQVRTDPIGNKIEVGVLGVKRTVAPQFRQKQTYGPVESVAMAFRETWSVSQQILAGLPKLPGAVMSALTLKKQSELGGPLAIIEMSAQATKSGLASFMMWLAIFSIMLAIMNLLPIPLLDGGHLMFYALEAVRGRPLDERKQELGFKIGFAIIATLMIAATVSDIMRKFGVS
jgi:regulator of sigma E protease